MKDFLMKQYDCSSTLGKLQINAVNENVHEGLVKNEQKELEFQREVRKI